MLAHAAADAPSPNRSHRHRCYGPLGSRRVAHPLLCVPQEPRLLRELIPRALRRRSAGLSSRRQREEGRSACKSPRREGRRKAP